MKQIVEQLCQYFRRIEENLNGLLDEVNEKKYFSCPKYFSGNPGKPKFEVSKDQIEFLREMHFSWAKIAELLGISPKTLSRRRKELEIEAERVEYNDITDQYLRFIMQEIRLLTPKLFCNAKICSLSKFLKSSFA